MIERFDGGLHLGAFVADDDHGFVAAGGTLRVRQRVCDQRRAGQRASAAWAHRSCRCASREPLPAARMTVCVTRLIASL